MVLLSKLLPCLMGLKLDHLSSHANLEVKNKTNSEDDVSTKTRIFENANKVNVIDLVF
jgi:hypothetical protein